MKTIRKPDIPSRPETGMGEGMYKRDSKPVGPVSKEWVIVNSALKEI